MDQKKLMTLVHAMPPHLRLHKFYRAANSRLSGAVERIVAVLGPLAGRRASSDIRRELALPIAEKRALLTKYDVEQELFTALREGA